MDFCSSQQMNKPFVLYSIDTTGCNVYMGSIDEFERMGYMLRESAEGKPYLIIPAVNSGPVNANVNFGPYTSPHPETPSFGYQAVNDHTQSIDKSPFPNPAFHDPVWG